VSADEIGGEEDVGVGQRDRTVVLRATCRVNLAMLAGGGGVLEGACSDESWGIYIVMYRTGQCYGAGSVIILYGSGSRSGSGSFRQQAE
jgi:hypothetical protein